MVIDTRLRKTCVLTILLLTSSTVRAGVNAWTTNGPPFELQNTFSVAIDPGDGVILYAPPWRSTDEGQTWQLTDLDRYVSPQGLSPTGVFLSAAAGPSGTAYVGTSCCYPYDLSPGFLLKSTDAGATWIEISSFVGCAVSRLLVDPVVPSTLFAVTDCNPFEPGLPRSTRLARSVDGGRTWAPPIGQQPKGLEQVAYLFALAIDPTNHETLYISTNIGLFRSHDGGISWSPVSTYPYPFSDLVVDPSNAMTIYGAVSGLGVLRSTDGGKTFQPASVKPLFRNGLTNPLVNVLLIDPQRPCRLYAAAQGTKYDTTGVFVSDDGGASWNAVADGLPRQRFGHIALAIHPRGKFLLAQLLGTGVFEYDFPPGFMPLCRAPALPEPRVISPRR